MCRMILTTRFGDAAVYAASAHAGQVRKETTIPSNHQVTAPISP
jgi:hypothetical protein